jgi:hypothetical protein
MHKEVDLNNLTQNVMPLIYNACVVHCTRRNNAELQATAYRHPHFSSRAYFVDDVRYMTKVHHQ